MNANRLYNLEHSACFTHRWWGIVWHIIIYVFREIGYLTHIRAQNHTLIQKIRYCYVGFSLKDSTDYFIKFIKYLPRFGIVLCFRSIWQR